MFKCDPCSKTFSGVIPYNQHLDSEKHKKKLVSLSYVNPGKLEEIKANWIPDTSASNEIRCYVCNVSFNSINQYQIHSLSVEHANNVIKKQAVDEVDKAVEAVSSTVSANPGVNSCQNNQLTTQNDFILPSLQDPHSGQLISFSECKVCNKRFSGPEPYRQHLISAAHKMMVDVPSFPSSTQNPSTKFECEPCKKIFSGHVPYGQHLVSDIHKKKLKQLQLLEEFNKQRSPGSVMEMDTNVKESNVDPVKTKEINRPWFCSICMVQCSGLAPYTQHLAGEMHSKNVKRWDILSANTDLNLANGICSAAGTRRNNINDDCILPDASIKMATVQPEDINITEFYPYDKINFDGDSLKGISVMKENIEMDTVINNGTMDYEDAKGTHDRRSVNEMNNQSNQNGTATEDNVEELYEMCKLCNIRLNNKNEALIHFMSIEHFRKRQN